MTHKTYRAEAPTDFVPEAPAMPHEERFRLAHHKTNEVGDVCSVIYYMDQPLCTFPAGPLSEQRAKDVCDLLNVEQFTWLDEPTTITPPVLMSNQYEDQP